MLKPTTTTINDTGKNRMKSRKEKNHHHRHHHHHYRTGHAFYETRNIKPEYP